MIQVDLQSLIKNLTATPPKNLWHLVTLRLIPRPQPCLKQFVPICSGEHFLPHEGQFVRRHTALGLGNTSFLSSHQCSLSYRQTNGANSNNRSKIPTYNRLKLFNSFQKYHIFSNISRFWTYNEVEFLPKTRNYLWLEYKLSLQTSVKPRLLYGVIKTSTETRSN